MPRDSGITTPSALAGLGPGSTGIGHSATGSLEKIPAPSDFQAMAPREIDQVLQALLPPRVASSVKADWRWRKRDAQDKDWSEPYIAGWNLGTDFSEEEARDALRLLEVLSAPAKRGDCAKEVAWLRAMTKAASQTDDDMTFQFASMVEELMPYPPDVVTDACRAWAAKGTFFPSWAELKQICDQRFMKRCSLLAALRKYIEANGAAP